MALPPSTKLGPYEIVASLGAGGMGEVYRARDTRLGRMVAIKVLFAAFTANADRVRRFEQEARAVGMLNHPNILSVYDAGTHEGLPYLVTELLEGGTLRETGMLARRKTLDYAQQIARGLFPTKAISPDRGQRTAESWLLAKRCTRRSGGSKEEEMVARGNEGERAVPNSVALARLAAPQGVADFYVRFAFHALPFSLNSFAN
jgi:Protein kinase domain